MATNCAKPPQVVKPTVIGSSQRWARPDLHQGQDPSPLLNGTMTRMPGLTTRTSGPTSSITPHISWPNTWGRSKNLGQSPAQPCQSLRQMPLAATRTTAPWRPGSGSGTSRTTRGSR